MQSSSEQPLVGEERYVTTRITAAKETREQQGRRPSNGSERRVADVTHAPSLARENQLQRQFLIIT